MHWRILMVVALFTACLASPALATPINIDWETTDTNTPSFTWQGQTFTMQTGTVGTDANHRIVGDSNGQVDFFLEEPGKVSYKTTLPNISQNPTGHSLGFIYGSDLSQATPSFSNLQGYYQNASSSPNVVSQLLVGSDAFNNNSPFAGTILTDAAGSNTQGFLNNTPYGNEGLFEMDVFDDGNVETTVTMNGVNGSADVDDDLTPSNSISPFRFPSLILQVESFQGATSFSNQFGTTGQKFSYTSLSVPEPASAALLAFGSLALLRRRR